MAAMMLAVSCTLDVELYELVHAHARGSLIARRCEAAQVAWEQGYIALLEFAKVVAISIN